MSYHKHSSQLTGLSEDQVEAYLQDHPDFFHHHLGLLESLSIPHPSGDAVSLISKQLEIFRSKHHELENQLNALIEIAHDNDTSLNRMHELSLALMEANTLEVLVDNLDKVFHDCFLTDFSRIYVIQQNLIDSSNDLFIDAEDMRLQTFERELRTNQPKCGTLTLAQARFLFADKALEVKSCAVIPMVFTELEGLIAIGSREPTRFHNSMGHLFLIQIAEVIGTRLISLLK